MNKVAEIDRYCREHPGARSRLSLRTKDRNGSTSLIDMLLALKFDDESNEDECKSSVAQAETEMGIPRGVRQVVQAGVEQRREVIQAATWAISDRPGLLIYGGRGKSVCAASLIAGPHRKIGREVRCMFTSETSLMAAVARPSSSELERYLGMEFLIVDYCGTSSPYAATDRGFPAAMDVVRRRLENRRRTVITFGGTVEQFRGTYKDVGDSVLRLVNRIEVT